MARTRKIIGCQNDSALPLHEIAVSLAGIRQSFLRRGTEPAVPHDNLAVDHHGAHAARFGAVDDLAENIVYRLVVQRIDVDKNQVRAFARLDGAAERIETERFGAAVAMRRTA
jgi:hypothetical protein